jgi:hypothetical protein
MPLSMDQIKVLVSLDLENFEIRGAKYGVNNAKSTSILYVDGQYIPNKNILKGTATFTADSSFITGLTVDPPYSSFDASNWKVGDQFHADSSSFVVRGVRDATSLELNNLTGLSGVMPYDSTLIYREYLVEPDKYNNTLYGDASFTSGSQNVYGIGTTWSSQLLSGDFIKHDGYQQYFRIDTVPTNDHLTLVSAYTGDTTVGSYKAKHQLVGQMDVRYTQDNFTYEKNSGRWTVDATTDSGIPTSADYFIALNDGINLMFSHTIKSTDPDLMDTATVNNKVFAQKTENDAFQFPLPVIPNPEDTLQVRLNNSIVYRPPTGNDYVISYSPDPIYVYPPPKMDRRVANLMFLKVLADTNLLPANTQTGIAVFTDYEGNPVAGIMPGTENIRIDGTRLQVYTEYVLDADAATAYVSSEYVNEPLVKYIASDKSYLIDYGIEVTRNGIRQQYSIPPRNTDAVRIVLNTGRVVPVGKDHPGPGEEYVIDYQVDSDPVDNEVVSVTSGMTSFRLQRFPVKDGSVILLKNGVALEEYTDFMVLVTSGRVILTTPLVITDSISVSYVPLAGQTNGITYADGKNYCTVYDSRLTIRNVDLYEFTLEDYRIDTETITVQRICNQTHHADYDLASLSTSESTVRVSRSSTNLAIGLSDTDIVTIDFTYESETLEYSPLAINNFTIPEGSSSFYIVGQDVRSDFSSGAIVRMEPSDIQRTFLFPVSSTTYDGEDTLIKLDSSSSEEIINPYIYVTDSSVSFGYVGYTAAPIVSGANTISFPNTNSPNIFRTNTAIKVDLDVYSISSASYDQDATATVVTLASDVSKDYTSSGILSALTMSDGPLYVEGDTVLVPRSYALDDPQEPGMTVSYYSERAAYITTDSSRFVVATDQSSYLFSYSTIQHLSDLSSAIFTAGISDLALTLYASGHDCFKMYPVTGKAVSDGAPLLLTLKPALLLDGTDTVDFSLSNGTVVLNHGVAKGQRYNLDYLGLDYLGNRQVTVSGDFFTTLPKGSKLSASFEYDNLDQFYIQVMSQRNFLEQVIQPRVKEEAVYLSGSVGQGGDVPGDDAQGNSEGGVTGDEYKRQDLEIECRVFKQIYDWFQNRLQAFGNEYYAALGWKLCNNDGLLSSADETLAPYSFNRMWPTADYTSLPPYPITPLTGQTRGPGQAIFINGQKDVTRADDGVSIWSRQIFVGDWMRPSDMTTNFQVQSIINDSSIVLTTPYVGPTSPIDGEEFVITSSFPLYDDDGYVGPKIVGTKTKPTPKLKTGDTFRCFVDGNLRSCAFPSSYNGKSISKFNLFDVADYMNTQLPSINTTVEWAYDPATSYGYKNVIALRVDSSTPYNCLLIGDSSSVAKLGFVVDSSACGNYDRSSSGAEILWDTTEAGYLNQEIPLLDTIVTAGVSNKLARVSYTGQANAVKALAMSEALCIIQEQYKLTDESNSESWILQEPGQPSYNSTLIAFGDTTDYQADCSAAYTYDYAVGYDFTGKVDAWKWNLDYLSHIQGILGTDITGVGVPVSSGPGVTDIRGQTEFILQHFPSDHDRRIMNWWGVPFGSVIMHPYVIFNNDNSSIDGSFTGWVPSTEYSLNNEITFHLNDTVGLFNIQYAGPDALGYFNVTYNNVADMTNISYLIDTSSMNLYWHHDTTYEHRSFLYSSYPTVQSFKNDINLITGLSASGSIGFDASTPPFKQDATNISIGAPPTATVVDATIYPQLTGLQYTTNMTSLQLSWTHVSSETSTFPYADYTTVAAIRTGINGLAGIVTHPIKTGADTSRPPFKFDSGFIPPDATLYPTLRPLTVYYPTISDEMLYDRTTFVHDRSDVVTARITYLDETRQPQIINHIKSEEYLRATDGGTGNLYNWADNRFNRSQGCLARLRQTEKIIERNKSALAINKRLM